MFTESLNEELLKSLDELLSELDDSFNESKVMDLMEVFTDERRRKRRDPERKARLRDDCRRMPRRDGRLLLLVLLLSWDASDPLLLHRGMSLSSPPLPLPLREDATSPSSAATFLSSLLAASASLFVPGCIGLLLLLLL
jgi:hypothetical protein